MIMVTQPLFSWASKRFQFIVARQDSRPDNKLDMKHYVMILAAFVDHIVSSPEYASEYQLWGWTGKQR